MHDDHFVDAIAEIGEQRGTRALAVRLRAHATQQMVDRGAEGREFRLIGLQVDAPREAPADCDALHLLRKHRHGPQLTALKPIQHEQQDCDQSQKYAHESDDRHRFSAIPCILVMRIRSACVSHTSI